jgi:peptidoglycan/LPS O-acetylase OafA/YrhL
LLFIIAEIGAAFAGFSSLVAGVSRRSGDTPERVRLIFKSLQNALIASLLAVAFALLPSIVVRQSVEPGVAWRASAAACSLILGLYIARALRRLLGAYHDSGESVPRGFIVNTAVSIGCVFIFAACAVGILPTSSYLVALAGILYSAGVAFLRFFVSMGQFEDAA